MEAYLGNDPRFANIEWIRIDPNTIPRNAVSNEEERILRARNAWQSLS
jgi:hypothetical protein